MTIIAYRPSDDDSPELPALPAPLLGLLVPYLALLLAWLSALVYHALLRRCRSHPLVRLQAVAPESKPSSHRTVYASPYHSYLRAGAAFNATEAGRSLLRGRWQVEPAVAWLVRYEGCRRARRVGQAAAQCQLYQACAGRNLWRYLARRRRGQAATPERSGAGAGVVPAP